MNHQIMVTSTHNIAPFSRGRIVKSLLKLGTDIDQAYDIANAIKKKLGYLNKTTVSIHDIEDLIEEFLQSQGETALVQQFHTWRRIIHHSQPIVILIGGATGVGKSTLATELAYRLKVFRIIGTDVIREAMRSFFSPELFPHLFASSFETDPLEANKQQVLHHFESQAESVMLGIKAELQRINHEGLSAIIEGTHLLPGSPHLTPLSQSANNAPLVIHVILHIAQNNQLKQRFIKRDHMTGHARKSKIYLKNLPKICDIQNHLLKLAHKHQIPVIESNEIESTLRQIFKILYEKIDKPT